MKEAEAERGVTPPHKVPSSLEDQEKEDDDKREDAHKDKSEQAEEQHKEQEKEDDQEREEANKDEAVPSHTKDEDDNEDKDKDEEGSDEEYKETIHDLLIDMGQKMERIYHLDSNKTEVFKDHKEVLDDVKAQVELQVKQINKLQEEVAIQKSFVDIEHIWTTEFKEETEQVLKRAITAKNEIKEQQKQKEKIRDALWLANERRVATQDALNKFLEDPILAAPTNQPADQTLKAKNEAPMRRSNTRTCT